MNPTKLASPSIDRRVRQVIPSAPGYCPSDRCATHEQIRRFSFPSIGRELCLSDAGRAGIVRTGAFEPWGNLALRSGVDAPIWFQKPGTIVPGYYEKRASYKDEK